MSYKIQDSDIEILRNAGVSENDIKHCVKVAKKALEIAERAKTNVDMELVGRGALFHDLGKAKTHEIGHGKIGAEIGNNWDCQRRLRYNGKTYSRRTYRRRGKRAWASDKRLYPEKA